MACVPKLVPGSPAGGKPGPVPGHKFAWQRFGGTGWWQVMPGAGFLGVGGVTGGTRQGVPPTLPSQAVHLGLTVSQISGTGSQIPRQTRE